MADQPPPREYRTGSDPRTLRDALGCFATGVTVVTCLDARRQAGRADRQQLHLGVARPAAAAGLRRQGRRRARAALIEAAISRSMCCRPGSSRPRSAFRPATRTASAPTPGRRGELGAPVLKESLGVFECERHAVHDGGDHHILVGQVVKASFDAEPRPLALLPRQLPPAALRLSRGRRSALPDAW